MDPAWRMQIVHVVVADSAHHQRREKGIGDMRKIAKKRSEVLTLTARLGRRDKRGSPLKPQAIGMAWVRACRRSGRVPRLMLSPMNSTVFSALPGIPCSWSLCDERGRQRFTHPAWPHPRHASAEAEELHQLGAACAGRRLQPDNAVVRFPNSDTDRTGSCGQ
jgi:hypothetical protein